LAVVYALEDTLN
jgi:hypothetical protein